VSTKAHPRYFGGVRVANLFSFLCCPIMYPSVHSSVLWCPLRFPHENDVRFVLPLVVCRRAHVLLCFLCVFAHSDVQHFVLSNAFTFWVPCRDVRYDVRIKNMFGSSLPPVVGRMSRVLLTLFCVCLRIVVSNTYRDCVVCFCVSSSCVLCTQCCQFLWIFHSWLPLRFSHRFI
jgi:hypothetical protein